MQMDEENAAAVLCKEKKEGRSEGQSEEGTEHLRLLDHCLRIYTDMSKKSKDRLRDPAL